MLIFFAEKKWGELLHTKYFCSAKVLIICSAKKGRVFVVLYFCKFNISLTNSTIFREKSRNFIIG